MYDRIEMCPICGRKQAQEPHTCPFAEDVHGDYETLCTCCKECEEECLYDI